MDTPRRPRPGFARQSGIAAVEFALCSIFFFVFVFGFVEMARAVYLWNTMTEVTRRAARGAAVSDFSNMAVMDALRRDAMFGGAQLPLAGGISAANLQINFLQANGVTPVAPMPASPDQNLINCTANHNGANCIRFVQVRMCQEPGGGCTPLPYTLMLQLLDRMFDPATFRFPSFATVTPVATLGRVPGAATGP